MIGHPTLTNALAAPLLLFNTAVALKFTGFPPCDALVSANLTSSLLFPSSPDYESRVLSWWSANARRHPWCIVQPTSTSELSIAVRALTTAGPGAGDWHIAVRSGGHSLFSNIENGVTIDLGLMNRSWYDASSGLVSLEPGAAWKDVYYDLLTTANVTVTGGRDGGVGVGGFLLGGGNSYYSTRNGFGCDTVVNFEVVLADGSVVQANMGENADLWKALKGGGMNFGIVSRFDVQSMPAIDLAYGQNVLSVEHSDQVIEAVVGFTNRPEEEGQDDHLIVVYEYSPDFGPDVLLLAIRVNTRGNLNTTGFENITSIPSLSSSWGHTSHADAANDSQVPAGTKNTGTTLTFPNDPTILRHAASLFTALVTNLTTRLRAGTFTAQTFLQPLPSYLSAISAHNGGNVLGMSRISGNAVLWTCGVGLIDTDDASLAIAEAELGAMTAQLNKYAVEWTYMNYAGPGQDPIGSYGEENVAYLREVSSRYDSVGFWQRMVPGGFKVSRALV